MIESKKALEQQVTGDLWGSRDCGEGGTENGRMQSRVVDRGITAVSDASASKCWARRRRQMEMSHSAYYIVNDSDI
jgi:hypothetical protein